MRFDLSSLRTLPGVRVVRVRRWTGAVCFTLFAFISVAAPVYYYGAHRGFTGWTSAQTAALVFVAFLSGMGALFFAGAAPPPTSIDVGPEGLAFELKGRQTWRVSWADPALFLRIYHSEGPARNGRQGSPMIIAMGRFSSRNYLTREAYDEIIAQATAHGLQVATVPASRVGWTRTTITLG